MHQGMFKILYWKKNELNIRYRRLVKKINSFRLMKAVLPNVYRGICSSKGNVYDTILRGTSRAQYGTYKAAPAIQKPESSDLGKRGRGSSSFPSSCVHFMSRFAAISVLISISYFKI